PHESHMQYDIPNSPAVNNINIPQAATELYSVLDTSLARQKHYRSTRAADGQRMTALIADSSYSSGTSWHDMTIRPGSSYLRRKSPSSAKRLPPRRERLPTG